MPRKPQASRRIRKRVEVQFGPDHHDYLGYTRNVSAGGIMVATTHVFAPGTILRMAIKFPSTTYNLTGRVVWAREGTVQWLATGRIGMGISFLGSQRAAGSF